MVFTNGVLICLIGGVVVLLLGIWVFISNEEFGGGLMVGIGALAIAVGIASSIIDVGRDQGHARALRDLKVMGFNVRWLSINEGRATIAIGNMGCQQTFSLGTESGRYVLKIPSDVGGAIVYPRVLRSLEQYCSR